MDHRLRDRQAVVGRFGDVRPRFIFLLQIHLIYRIFGEKKIQMQAATLEAIGKLNRLEKLELAHYLLDELAKEEAVELSAEQQTELLSRWQEIENDTTELSTGIQIRDELKEKYGWSISLP